MTRRSATYCRCLFFLLVLLHCASPGSANEQDDRKAVAQRIAVEIANHQSKKLYVSDFLDSGSGRVDKGCYFSSMFSTLLAEQKQGFQVINRIDGQKLLTKAEFITTELQKRESPAKVGAATGADVLLMGKFVQEGESMTLELSLMESSTGKAFFHLQYEEQSTDAFEALFPAAFDSTGTIFYFPGLDGITQPKCLQCPRVASSSTSEQASAEEGDLMSVVFTADGKLDQARIVKGVDVTSDQAALEALKNWKAEPAKDAAGNAVPVRLAMIVGANASDATAPYRAGVNGVTPPRCIYCPPPQYASKAKEAKVEGTVVLDVLVTPDGRATKIIVIKAPDDSLAEKAKETVATWKLAPAQTKEGKNVAARVQIQVTFHLFPQ